VKIGAITLYFVVSTNCCPYFPHLMSDKDENCKKRNVHTDLSFMKMSTRAHM